MKIIATIFAAATLVGCATSSGLSDAERAEMKERMDGFDVACRRSGYVGGSAEWQSCVMTLARQYINMRHPAATAPSSPSTINCQPDAFGKGVTCTQY